MMTSITNSTTWSANRGLPRRCYHLPMLTHAAYSFRSLHRALLMVKKIPTPETVIGGLLGGHPQLWGPLASPLILGAGGDHTIREISTFLLLPPLSLGHFLPVSSPFSSKQAPFNAAGRSGERCKRPPAESEAVRQPKSNLMHPDFKI